MLAPINAIISGPTTQIQVKKGQVTTFKDDDVNWPSQGPEDIIFGAGGKLYVMSLVG